MHRKVEKRPYFEVLALQQDHTIFSKKFDDFRSREMLTYLQHPF